MLPRSRHANSALPKKDGRRVNFLPERSQQRLSLKPVVAEQVFHRQVTQQCSSSKIFSVDIPRCHLIPTLLTSPSHRRPSSGLTMSVLRKVKLLSSEVVPDLKVQALLTCMLLTVWTPAPGTPPSPRPARIIPT